MNLGLMKLINFRGRLLLTLWVVLVSIFINSCATIGTCEVDIKNMPARWLLSSRPVEVKISADITQECLDNVLAGLDFWVKEKGINYLSPKMVDKPVRGNGIIVSNQLPWSPPPTLGSALSGKDKGIMLYSEIRYRNCDFWVVVHEFGHALGLIHTDNQIDMTEEMRQQNIMWSTNEYMGHNVTDKQLEQIR